MLKANQKNNIYYVVEGNALTWKTTRKKAKIKSLIESLLVFNKQKKVLKL